MSYDQYKRELLALFDNYFSNFDHIGIALSGGIDSNYLMLSAKKNCKKVYTYTNSYKKDDLADESEIVEHMLYNSNITPRFIENSDSDVLDFGRRLLLPYQSWFENGFRNMAKKMAEDGCQIIAFGFGLDELLGNAFQFYDSRFIRHPFTNHATERYYKISSEIKQQIKASKSNTRPREINSLLKCNLIENYLWLRDIFEESQVEVVLPYYETKFLKLLTSVRWDDYRKESKYPGKKKFLLYDIASELFNIDLIKNKPVTKGEVTDLFALSIMQRNRKEILELAKNSILCDLKILNKKQLLRLRNNC